MKVHQLRRVLLVIAACLMIANVALADLGDVIIRSDPIFHSYGISLSQASGSRVHIVFNVTAKQTSAILGAPSYDVQRYTGASWTTVAEDLAGNQTTDSASYSFSKNYSGVSGERYRVKAKFYCKTYAGASQSVTYTSASITLS